jgi:hypothetical protein
MASTAASPSPFQQIPFRYGWAAAVVILLSLIILTGIYSDPRATGRHDHRGHWYSRVAGGCHATCAATGGVEPRACGGGRGERKRPCPACLSNRRHGPAWSADGRGPLGTDATAGGASRPSPGCGRRSAPAAFLESEGLSPGTAGGRIAGAAGTGDESTRNRGAAQATAVTGRG